MLSLDPFHIPKQAHHQSLQFTKQHWRSLKSTMLTTVTSLLTPTGCAFTQIHCADTPGAVVWLNYCLEGHTLFWNNVNLEFHCPEANFTPSIVWVFSTEDLLCSWIIQALNNSWSCLDGEPPCCDCQIELAEDRHVCPASFSDVTGCGFKNVKTKIVLQWSLWGTSSEVKFQRFQL